MFSAYDFVNQMHLTYHARTLLDGPAAAEEGDHEDDGPHCDQQHWRHRYRVVDEVRVVVVCTLDGNAHDHYAESSDLQGNESAE